jgi:endoglucanase
MFAKNRFVIHPFVLIGICLLLTGRTVGQTSTASFVDQHGALSVKGTQLVDSAGQPIVLRGMSFGWHVWWPQFWNKDVVKWLKDDWKCTVVRCAMGIEPDGGYLKSPEQATQLVEAVVDACIENGMYVIIDWHDHHASSHLEESKAFFISMAQKYGNHPNVIYEIYNEPEKESWESVKNYSEAIIQAIRQIDPDNIILVGSPNWDQDVHSAADDPIVGVSNVMYTLHFYAATHKQWLRDRADYALQKGLPIFVSEYGGSEASGDGILDIKEWNTWIEWMNDRNISWCTWSISDKREICSVLIPGASAKGGWRSADLTPSGRHARELLRKHNSQMISREKE